MDEKLLNDFIKTLPQPTTYLDGGYAINLDKNIFQTNDQSFADFNSLVEAISFDKLTQGVTVSAGKKIKIDFDKGQISINDGSVDRAILGDF